IEYECFKRTPLSLHQSRQTEEVLQLEEGVVTEEQTAVTIQSVQQAAAFADHNLTYHAAGDGTGAVSVTFTGAQQAVAYICNPFSNGGSPAEEMVGGEMRFANFSADTVRDGAAKAVMVQSDPTFTQAGGEYPPDVLQASTPRTIAPRTHTYSFTYLGENYGILVFAVERRRRDKINNRIITLSKIILDCNIDSTKTGAKKGGILSKRLQDHFKEVLRVQADNQLLKQQVHTYTVMVAASCCVDVFQQQGLGD
uniref:Upstream transcription factor 2, c-fos interacting n=1 Tax=Oncorhynchus kisutch TaxID=8019 RepID=A0A8C7MCQ1_ONCKI